MSLSREERFDSRVERQMRDLYESLSEKDRRRYAAVEAVKLPHGGQTYITEVLGCCPDTLRKGVQELEQLADGDPVEGRVRREGAGRPKKRSTIPA